MAVTNSAWDGSASRFSDQQYARSAVLDRADCSSSMKEAPAKTRYALPIREPGGTINSNALGSAAAAIAGARGGVKACPAAISAAARRLLRAYSEANIDPPESLRRRAG
jgi:hypothetical protein